MAIENLETNEIQWKRIGKNITKGYKNTGSIYKKDRPKNMSKQTVAKDLK